MVIFSSRIGGFEVPLLIVFGDVKELIYGIRDTVMHRSVRRYFHQIQNPGFEKVPIQMMNFILSEGSKVPVQMISPMLST